jgi:hypothetical protein
MVSALLRKQNKPSREDLNTFKATIDLIQSLVPYRTISIAPVRTKPERVYSQIKEAFQPTGDHIPFVLDKLLRDRSSKESATVLKTLDHFGIESGLYKEVDERKLGNRVGEPFRIVVDIGGRMRNLVDVGYGVSQCVPIIVQSVLASPKSIVLMQQPEIHLHPKAQAALGTILTAIVTDGDRRMVVETHSDYILDRVRQEVAAGNIPPEKVNITFVERSRLESIVHTISLDSNGNLLNVPNSYRAFFFQEQTRLINRANGGL